MTQEECPICEPHGEVFINTNYTDLPWSGWQDTEYATHTSGTVWFDLGGHLASRTFTYSVSGSQVFTIEMGPDVAANEWYPGVCGSACGGTPLCIPCLALETCKSRLLFVITKHNNPVALNCALGLKKMRFFAIDCEGNRTGDSSILEEPDIIYDFGEPDGEETHYSQLAFACGYGAEDEMALYKRENGNLIELTSFTYHSWCDLCCMEDQP